MTVGPSGGQSLRTLTLTQMRTHLYPKVKSLSLILTWIKELVSAVLIGSRDLAQDSHAQGGEHPLLRTSLIMRPDFLLEAGWE